MLINQNCILYFIVRSKFDIRYALKYCVYAKVDGYVWYEPWRNHCVRIRISSSQKPLSLSLTLTHLLSLSSTLELLLLNVPLQRNESKIKNGHFGFRNIEIHESCAQFYVVIRKKHWMDSEWEPPKKKTTRIDCFSFFEKKLRKKKIKHKCLILLPFINKFIDRKLHETQEASGEFFKRK